jgi:hypothetical protein
VSYLYGRLIGWVFGVADGSDLLAFCAADWGFPASDMLRKESLGYQRMFTLSNVYHLGSAFL